MRVTGAVLILLFAMSGGRVWGAESPEELVRQSLRNFERSYKDAPLYTYMQRDESRTGNTVKSSVAQILTINGVPCERVVSRNGQPLTPEQDAKEQAKLAKRQAESPAEQRKRLNDYQEARSFLKEVPSAFSFALAGEEVVNGRSNYVIKCTPKAGYQPANSRAAMFSHLRAKLWVDKQDLQWTKAQAEVLDTISIGWVLARIGPGATMSIEQHRMNAQDWLLSSLRVEGDARVLLVKDHPIHESLTCYDFRKIDKTHPATALEPISSNKH